MLKQFWQHVEPEGEGCREWLKTINQTSGYGIFRGMSTHIFAYMDVNPDEDIWGMHIHHKCENKKCVNPDQVDPQPVVLVAPVSKKELKEPCIQKTISVIVASGEKSG